MRGKLARAKAAPIPSRVDIDGLKRDIAAVEDGALAPRTRAAIQRVGRQYLETLKRWRPDLPPLPVTFEKLAAHEMICLRADLRSSTLKTYRGLLKRFVGAEDFLPTEEDRRRYRDFLRSYSKLEVRLPKGSNGFRRRHLLQARCHPSFDAEDDYAATVWLLANVAHQGHMRGIEVVGDITLKDLFETPEGDYVLYIHKSKANKCGRPEAICFPRLHDARFSVPDLIDSHLRRVWGKRPFSNLKRPLFARPRRRADGTTKWFARWSRPAFVVGARWLASLTETLIPSGITGHSFRSGGASDALRGGAPLHLVMAQGRWRARRSVILYDQWSIEERAAGMRKWLSQSHAAGARLARRRKGRRPSFRRPAFRRPPQARVW